MAEYRQLRGYMPASLRFKSQPPHPGGVPLAEIRTAYNCLDVLSDGLSVNLWSAQGSYGYYHPQRLFTGYTWDCLSVGPLLAQRDSCCCRILLLGLGGGTVVRQCRALYPGVNIDAVEIDEKVISASKKFFHIRGGHLSIIHQDAAEFLAMTDRKYDAILDDTWLSANARRKKLLFSRAGYLADVQRTLSATGIYATSLVRNGTPSELSLACQVLSGRFGAVAIIYPPLGSTAVVVAGQKFRSWRSVERASIARRPRFRAILSAIRFRPIR